MKINRFFYLFVFVVLISQLSCKKETKVVEKDTFSSPKTLFVEYVSAYTTGYISKNSEITVKLTNPVANAEAGKEIGANVFSFEPALKGSAVWEDDKTIVFKPAEALKNGQRYKTIFLLDKLVEVPADKREFKFTFECIPQNFNVKIDGISVYDAKDLSKVKLTGTIQTADKITEEQAEQILTARQNGIDLDISYEHGIGQNIHQFTIEQIKRTDDKGKIKIEWDGAGIGVDKSDATGVEIPSLLDFKVSSVQIIRSGDKYISVKFSDPIDEKQNLRGLVRMSKGTAPRVVVNLNELKIYTTSNLAGAVELIIDKSIKNNAGYALSNDFETTLQFSQQKPQVKITANKGVIMPSSDGLIVPFEAVSLNAHDLTIVHIFENNVLQYLQENDPGGNYYLRRVGRPVARKTIPLATMGATNLNEWNRYSIDVSEYVDVEPGAFYQVRLSFRKSQSLYF
ncbi:MAG: hypothetical protein KAI29_08525, partial [Cyclobacteriaceae bacterium]|nr:hypothetical protein [Cyclobacteriaceae bacterium]